MEGFLGVEAEVTLQPISVRLKENRKEPYSFTSRYVKSRVVVTLVWATYCCIWGDRVPYFQISKKSPLWGDGAGLQLIK